MAVQTSSPVQTETERALLYAVRAGVLLVLITPLIVSTQTLFPFIVGKAIFSRSVIEITFALWVILAFAFPSYRLSRSWVLIALAVWVAMSIIAGFAGVSLQRSLWSTYERMQGIFDQVHWFAFIIVTASVTRTLSNWKVLFSANLAVSVVVSLVGAASQYELIHWDFLRNALRVESTLGNATYVGAYTMVNILIAAAMIGHSWRDRATQAAPVTAPRRQTRSARRRRAARRRTATTDYLPWLMAFWFTATVINLWVLWLALARGAILGLASGVVVFALVYVLWGRIQTLKRIAYGIIAAVVAIVAVFILARATPVFDPVTDSNLMLTRLVSTGFNDNSIKGRLTSWRAGLRGYLDKPIFGWGPENYLIAWGRYFDSASGIRERFDQAHNKVLEELTTKGAVGATSYLGIWVAMGWVMVRSIRRRREYEQVFVAFVAAAMVGFFVQNLFLFDSPVTSLQFAILVAFALREELVQSRSEGDPEEQTPVPPLSRTDASRLAGLSHVTDWFRTVPGGTAGAALIAVVLALSLWFFNIRPFEAGRAVLIAERRFGDPTITWDQRFALYQESIDEFPALANYPRQILLSRVSNNIQFLSEQEFDQALTIIKRLEVDALDGEPQSWRIEVSLARFYQAASRHIDAVYLEAARMHMDKAVEFAPRTLDVEAVLRDQEFLEQQGSGS